MIDISKTIVVGKILGPFGIKGQIKISFSEDFYEFLVKNIEIIPIFSENGQIYKFKITSCKNNIINASEKGILDRTGAEKLGKPFLYCYKKSLPELQEDEYYYSDLVNSEVFDEEGKKLGIIKSLNNFGAGDIVEIKFLEGRVEMIPFQRDIFLSVKKNNVIIRIPNYS